MTQDDAAAATDELVAVYGQRVTIGGKARVVFVDEETEAPEYDDAGAQIDSSTLIIIGTADVLRDITLKTRAKHNGRNYRVIEKNSIPGGVQLTMIDASAR